MAKAEQCVAELFNTMPKQFQKDVGKTLTTGILLYCKFDEPSGNALDYWGTKDLVQTGTISSQTGKIGGARGAFPTDNTNYFQNTNVLTVNQSITISASFWIYKTAAASSQAIVSLGGGVTGTFEHRVLFDSTDHLQYAVISQNVATNGLITATDVIATSTWAHVMITYDGSTRTMELFVNNVSKGTVVATSSTYTDSSSVMIGGSYYNIGGNTKLTSAPNVYIEEFAYHNKVYVTQERTDLYNGGSGQTMVYYNGLFYNPFRGSLGRFFNGDLNIKGYWQLQGSSIDNSGSQYNGTDTSVSYLPKGIKGFLKSAYFNGSAYSSMGDNLAFDYNQAWTIGTWIYNGTTIASNIISKQQNAGAYAGYGIGTDATGKLQAFIYGGGAGSIIGTFPSAYSNGLHFVVVTYSGSNAVTGFTFYVDGVSVPVTNTSNTANTATILSTTPFQLSGRAGANNLWTGYLNETAVFSRVLSASEISQYYKWATTPIKKPNFLVVLTQLFIKTMTDTIMIGATRVDSLARLYGAIRSAIDSISIAASRVATLARSGGIFVRATADSLMNAVSRLATVGIGRIRAMSDSLMNAVSRLAVITWAHAYTRAMADSVMNAVSRLVSSVSMIMRIRAMADSISNAVSRLVTITRQYTIVRAMSDSFAFARLRFDKIKVLVNGFVVGWTNKLSTLGSTFTDKFQRKNTDWQNKF